MKVRVKQDLSELEAPKKAKTKETTKKTKKKTEEDDNEEWSVSLSEEAIQERRRNLLPENVQNIIDKANEEEEEEATSPTAELQSFIQHNPKGDIAGEIKRLQDKYQFSNSKRAPLLFDVLFSDSEQPPSLTKYIPLLKKISNDKSSKLGLLQSFVRLFSMYQNDKAMIKSLEQLYDSEVVDESILLSWYDKKLTDEYSKTALAPFISWLREAEEESE